MLRNFHKQNPNISHREIARRIGAQDSNYSTWVAGTRKVPSRFCFPLYYATGGYVTPHSLRPDIFPYGTKVDVDVNKTLQQAAESGI